LLKHHVRIEVIMYVGIDSYSFQCMQSLKEDKVNRDKLSSSHTSWTEEADAMIRTYCA